MNTHFGFAYLITNHVAASDFGTEVIWKTSIPKTHGGKDGYHGNCIIENTLVVGRLFCPPFYKCVNHDFVVVVYGADGKCD